jgi:adenylate cyclase
LKVPASIRNLKSGIIKAALFTLTFLLLILITQEYFFTIAPIKNLELQLIDQRFSDRGERRIIDSADVIILEINQETYEQIPHPYKTWPWPRSIFAKVIENLNQVGVKAIGIDILMTSDDRISSSNDSLLIKAIQKYRNVVVAGKIDLDQEANIKAADRGIKSTLRIVSRDFEFFNKFYHADSSIGIVQTPADFDDVYRRYTPKVTSTIYQKTVPSFAFALLNKFLGLNSNTLATKDKDLQLFNLSSKRIPAFDNTTMLVNFYGGDNTFRRIDLSQIFDDSTFTTELEIELGEELNEWDLIDKSQFKDKIVLIGSTMPEDRDFFNIPLSRGEREGDNIIAGVEFHANAIQNVIWDDYLHRQPAWQEIIIIFFIMLFVFYGSSFIKRRKIKYHSLLEILNFIFVVLIAYSIYELSFYLFVENNLVVSIVHPILGLFLSYFAVTAYHFISERMQNKVIRGMFSTYVSKDLG